MTAIGSLDRGRLLESLLSIGVDAPESCCENLSDEAVAGVLRWYRYSTQRGQHIGSGMVAMKLRNGGLEGYGTDDSFSPQSWYSTAQGRRRWIWNELHDLDPAFVEAAIITLVSEKREPSRNLVRRYALLAEKQDAEHIEACKEAADAQAERRIKDRNPLGPATGGMKKVDGLKAVQ